MASSKVIAVLGGDDDFAELLRVYCADRAIPVAHHDDPGRFVDSVEIENAGLVLVDLSCDALGERGGVAHIQHIRRRVGDKLPVWALSDSHMPEIAASGADDFIARDTPFATLAEKLERAVGLCAA